MFNMKRTSVVNALGLGVGVCVLYMIMSVFSSKKDTTDNIVSDLPVSIKDIQPAVNGKLEMTLSINIEDIVKHMEGFKNAKGEATSNPVPRETNFVKNVPNLCKDSTGVRYIVYVHTSPGNEKRRALVRKTWGNRNLFHDSRMQVVFMAGLAEKPKDQEILDREYEKYGDIVQGDFADSYHNLTFKGLMALKWVTKFCPQAKFTIKADDDAFVNIFDMLNFIETQKDRRRVIMCPLWAANSMPILRDPTKCMKWCVKYSEFPGMSHFPQYCAGLTYVMSNDIVPEMYDASLNTPFFWIDDVYITGILPSKLSNIHSVNFLRNFTLKEKVAEEDYLSKAKKTQYMVVHVKTEAIWYKMWEACLRRVTNLVLQTLNDHVIQQYPALEERKKKLPPHSTPSFRRLTKKTA